MDFPVVAEGTYRGCKILPSTSVPADRAVKVKGNFYVNRGTFGLMQDYEGEILENLLKWVRVIDLDEAYGA